MNQTKALKKKTKTRLTLLRNLNKGKARQQPRCAFQSIPLPSKFASASPIYHLYADLVLMEKNNKLVTEASLLNGFKDYKSVYVVESENQKMLKIKAESKKVLDMSSWREVVEKIQNSDIYDSKTYAESIRTYCERHETVLQELQKEQNESFMSNEKLQSLIEMNGKTEKTRKNLLKSFPCIEFKSQLINGQIQLTEVSVSEKYLSEMGYTLDSFSSTVLKEGLPEMTPLDSQGTASIARLRLQKYLTMDQDGYQTPEFESCLLMKNGCMKKIKMRIHYHRCYEKGVFGFVFIGVLLAKQKPSLCVRNSFGEGKMNNTFVELMSYREKEMNNFLALYYGERVDEKYSNINKICKIREIK